MIKYEKQENSYINIEKEREEVLYKGETMLKNPVEEFWDIELIANQLEKKLMVKFTDKIFNTNITIAASEVNSKEFRKKLLNTGDVDSIMFECIEMYISYLKRNKMYKDINSIDDDIVHIENVKEIAKVAYEEIINKVEVSKDKFPLEPRDFRDGVSYGVVIDETLIIRGEDLKDIIEAYEEKEFQAIIREWRNRNLLLSYNAKENRNTCKATLGRERANVYKIKLDKLYAKRRAV